jgi:formylglycine-generating enzyme required for sulfatase activity
MGRYAVGCLGLWLSVACTSIVGVDSFTQGPTDSGATDSAYTDGSFDHDEAATASEGSGGTPGTGDSGGSGGSGGEGGSDGSGDISDSSGDTSDSDTGPDAANPCTPSTQRCSGTSTETCGSDGQWGSAWPCATGACQDGACSGSTTAGTSCASSGNGVSNCRSAESCCTSLEVPGGTYDRTYTNTGTGPTGEADPATLSGFRLDKYEVTVGRFRQYVNYLTGGGVAPAGGSGIHAHLNGGKGLVNSATELADGGADGGAVTYETGWDATDWNSYIATGASAVSTWNGNLSDAVCDPASGFDFATWTNTVGTQETLPINCVNWYEASAFCIWDGGFLPTEAEFEYAAAGGGGVDGQRQYPWGSTPPGLASQYAIWECFYPSGTESCTGVANIAPVGAAPAGAGAWGQLDLAGSMFQWNLDWYAPYVDPCTDCAYLAPASYRTFRGGYFYAGGANGADFPYGDATFMLPSFRNHDTPMTRYLDYGFRCARTP